MKMYQVLDTDWPSRRDLNLFRTLVEAEQHIERSTRYDREHTMESGGVPGREYLVIKIVERVSQPCKVCGGEATNTPEQYARYPYCRNCYYVGNAAEDMHLNDLGLFRASFPDAEVGVEHTGGGCFWLAFRWEGDPIFYVATGGEAELPPDDHWNDGWGVVCRYSQDENGDVNDDDWAVLRESGWDQEDPTYLTKRQVIAAIKKDRKLREKARVS